VSENTLLDYFVIPVNTVFGFSWHKILLYYLRQGGYVFRMFVRPSVCQSSAYLENGWTDLAEILYAGTI